MRGCLGGDGITSEQQIAGLHRADRIARIEPRTTALSPIFCVAAPIVCSTSTIAPRPTTTKLSRLARPRRGRFLLKAMKLDDAMSSVLRGDTYFRRNDYDRAMREFEQAVERGAAV